MVRVCVILTVTPTWKKSSCFGLLALPIFGALFFVTHVLSFPLTPHVMYSLRSLATGTKPEPLACCRSEAGQGSILLVYAKRTLPLGPTMHSAEGPLRMEGDTVKAEAHKTHRHTS